MKESSRLTALLTAFLMLGASMASCAEEKTPEHTDEQIPEQIVQEETETEPETEYIDTLEARNMDGYAYRIVAQHLDDRPNFPMSDELNGEVLNDSLHARNDALESRLNIVIEPISYQDRELLKADVAKTITAQDDAYDLIITAFSDGINTLAMQNLLLDLTTIPHITLDSMYWNKSIADTMRFSGKQYFTSGVSSISYLLSSTHILVNRDLAKSLQLPDTQELVLEGKWTVDTMASLMENAAMDINGDGKMNVDDDRYAAFFSHTLGNQMYMAAGFHAVVCDDDGNWSLNIDEENSVSFIQKCAALFSDPNKVFSAGGLSETHYKAFVGGRSLLIESNVRNTVFFVRGMEGDFGILPNPVLNEGDPYLTECNTWIPSGIAVPITATNTERLGLIMETMAAYSHEHLVPAVAEKALGKVSNTSVDYQILSMTFDNCSFELNTIMDFGGSSSLLRGACLGTPENFVSSYQKIKKLAQEELEKFVESVNQ